MLNRLHIQPPETTTQQQTIATFFNQVMATVGGNTAGPGDAVVNVHMNHELRFASVEMRMVEEASNAMAGILFEGVLVTIKRPVDYNPALAACLGPSLPSPKLNLAAVGLKPESASGLECLDRFFVGGLLYPATEPQVQEMLESFCPLRELELVKDRQTGYSKHYGFCVSQDPSLTDIACALNSMIGDRTLTVRQVNQSKPETRGDSQPEVETVLLQLAQQQMQLEQLLYPVGAVPTKVVCLVDVVTADELKDDEAYEDMKLEACKYGNLVKVVIPRPDPSGHPVSGVGKVFMEYADIYGTTEAKIALHGRKFDGKPVVTIYYPDHKLANMELDGEL